MDGAQRNFSMMAQKIDRMRCLRERCDNYVRQIKLTLNETIHEQNALLNGTAIRNRLKYLGLTDDIITPPSSSSTAFNVDRIHPKNTDFDKKLHECLVIDDRSVRRYTKPDWNANDTHLSNDYGVYCSRPNYERRRVRRDFSANNTPYDDDYYNTCALRSYTPPIDTEKYGKIVNFRSSRVNPPEYRHHHDHQVYCFPTSTPVVQYARQTAERFYKRKPIKQYPEEEAVYWPRPPTGYAQQKPVRVVERREPTAADRPHYYCSDYRGGVGDRNVRPYVLLAAESRATRRFPANDNNNYVYRSPGYEYDCDSYCGYETDRPFSTITRPCSPVYVRDARGYDSCKTRLENANSLLEKKIRDYVWNSPEERAEKHVIPYYEPNSSTAAARRNYSDFKPLRYISDIRRGDDTFRTRSSSLLNRKNEPSTGGERAVSSERKRSDDQSFRPDDGDFPDVRSCKNEDDDYRNVRSRSRKTTAAEEAPTDCPKRISFDLRGENAGEIPGRDNYSIVGECDDDDSRAVNERRLTSGETESNTRLVVDKRRTSNVAAADVDSVSSSSSKLEISPTTDSRTQRQSTSKLGSRVNSLRSDDDDDDDDRLNFKTNRPENRSNSFEKSAPPYLLPPPLPEGEEEEENEDEYVSNGRNAVADYRQQLVRRDSSDGRRKSTDREMTERPNKPSFTAAGRAENFGESSDRRDRESNVAKRTVQQSSYADERKPRKENVPGSRKNSNSGDRFANDPQTGGRLNNESRRPSAVGRETDDSYGSTEREADRRVGPQQSVAGAVAAVVEDENVKITDVVSVPPQYDNRGGFDSETVSDGRAAAGGGGGGDDEVRRPEEISNYDDQEEYYRLRGRAAEDVRQERIAVADDENYYPDEPQLLRAVDDNDNGAAAVAVAAEERDNAAIAADEYYDRDYGNLAEADAVTGEKAHDDRDYHRGDRGYSRDDDAAAAADSEVLLYNRRPEDGLQETAVYNGENDVRRPAADRPHDDYDNYYGDPVVADGAENYYSSPAERPAATDVDNGYYYGNENAGEIRRGDDAENENADYNYYRDYSEMRDQTGAIRGGAIGAGYAEDGRAMEHDRYYAEGVAGNAADDENVGRDGDYYYGGAEEIGGGGGGGPVADDSAERRATDDPHRGYYYEQPAEGSYDASGQSTDLPLYYPDSHPDRNSAGDYHVQSYDDNPPAAADYNNYSENVAAAAAGDGNQS